MHTCCKFPGATHHDVQLFLAHLLTSEHFSPFAVGELLFPHTRWLSSLRCCYVMCHNSWGSGTSRAGFFHICFCPLILLPGGDLPSPTGLLPCPGHFCSICSRLSVLSGCKLALALLLPPVLLLHRWSYSRDLALRHDPWFMLFRHLLHWHSTLALLVKFSGSRPPNRPHHRDSPVSRVVLLAVQITPPTSIASPHQPPTLGSLLFHRPSCAASCSSLCLAFLFHVVFITCSGCAALRLRSSPLLRPFPSRSPRLHSAPITFPCFRCPRPPFSFCASRLRSSTFPHSLRVSPPCPASLHLLRPVSFPLRTLTLYSCTSHSPRTRSRRTLSFPGSICQGLCFAARSDSFPL